MSYTAEFEKYRIFYNGDLSGMATLVLPDGTEIKFPAKLVWLVGEGYFIGELETYIDEHGPDNHAPDKIGGTDEPSEGHAPLPERNLSEK